MAIALIIAGILLLMVKGDSIGCISFLVIMVILAMIIGFVGSVFSDFSSL